uniref:RING-type domain-containing protein n=1 Tax=viral metagenome TaxID=1070528 RepID=A0A6C0H6F0_9ZZZZ
MCEICSICHDNVIENEINHIELPCKHSFHFDCIENYCHSIQSFYIECPYCRAKCYINEKKEIIDKINKLNTELDSLLLINKNIGNHLKPLSHDKLFYETKTNVFFADIDNILFDENGSVKGCKYSQKDRCILIFMLRKSKKNEIKIIENTNKVCFTFFDACITDRYINFNILLDFAKEIKLYRQQFAEKI